VFWQWDAHVSSFPLFGYYPNALKSFKDRSVTLVERVRAFAVQFGAASIQTGDHHVQTL
jgi:hypothetical protein